MPAFPPIGLSEAIKAMKAAPMFSRISEPSVQRFLRRCLPRRCSAGEVLFQAGEAADRFFVVLRGRIKVYKTSSRGGEQILHLYGPGKTIGEAAMWAGVRFPAFGEAVEDSDLLVISRATLKNALSADPDLVMGMLAGMSTKLREFTHLIENLSLKDIPSRLAGALLEEAEHAGSDTFRLSQTKRELAFQIGTIPETLSRALGKLKKSGLIKIKGSVISVLDRKALRKFAEEG